MVKNIIGLHVSRLVGILSRKARELYPAVSLHYKLVGPFLVTIDTPRYREVDKSTSISLNKKHSLSAKAAEPYAYLSQGVVF
jgi:hypothetical protein